MTRLRFTEMLNVAGMLAIVLLLVMSMTCADDDISSTRPKRQPQLLGGLLQGIFPGSYGYGYQSHHHGFGGYGHHRPGYGGHHHHHYGGHHGEHHHHGHHHHHHEDK